MDTIQRKHWALALIAVLSAIIIFSLDVSGFFNPLSLKAYDRLFCLRSKMGLGHQQEAPIVIVEIDDRTFQSKSFKIPQILWHSYFAKVIEGLVGGGAQVIGLDFLLPQELFDDIVPQYSRTWLRTFASARQNGVPVVTGHIDTADRQNLPQKRYLQIIGAEHVGFFNLTADSDDFIRRQRLSYTAKDGGKRAYSFSYLIAHAFRPDLPSPDNTILVDYLSSSSRFEGSSFVDVYDKAVENNDKYFKNRFQGKIVLIGETDSLSSDRHPTPLYYLSEEGNKQTPGVEIHAHTVNTLLNGHFSQETPLVPRFCIYIALTLLVGLFTIYCAQRLVFIFFSTLILVYGGLCFFSFINYRLLPLVPGVAAIVLSQACFFNYRHYILDREKRKVRSIFQKFLPAKFVSQLRKSKGVASSFLTK